MASFVGASIFSPSPTPACYLQYGNRVSFCPPQRMVFLKLSENLPNSSCRWSFIVRAEVAAVSETIELPLTTETLESVAEYPTSHSHLVPLITELIEGAHLPAAVEPWVSKLSMSDWKALVLDVGSKDWTVAQRLVSYFKEKASALEECVLFPPRTEQSERENILEDDVENEVDALPDSSATKIDLKDVSSGTEAEAGSLAAPRKNLLILKLYRSLAMVLSNHRRIEEVEQLRDEIKGEGIQPTRAFYSIVLNFYLAEALTDKVLDVISEMEKAGVEPTKFMYEKVAFMFMKEKPLDLSVPTTIMRNLMSKGLPVSIGIFKNLLKAHWLNKDVQSAEEVFQALQAAGHSPDQKTILKVMYCQKQTGNHERVLELLEMMKTLGFKPDSSAYDQLIYAYSKAGMMEKAKESLSLYLEMGNKPTLVALNTLVHGYGNLGLYEDALQAFGDILEYKYRPNAVSYAIIIAAMVKAGHLKTAGELYRRMVKLGVQPKLHTYVALLRGFTKLDWTRDGQKVGKEMKKSTHQMTPEALGANFAVFSEGHWYRYAAAALRELEAGSILLDAAASASLIRSFSILADYPTPLSKAVSESNLEICKLLTSLFLTDSDDSRSRETTLEEEVLPYLAKWENVEDARALYNAFMECLWRRGSKTLAKTLLSSAREIYAQSSKPQVVGTERVLDVRGLSVGGAKTALFEWLMSVIEAEGKSESDDDVKMVIVTGDEFQVEVIQDSKVVKRALTSMLNNLSSPFKESLEDPKKLEAVRADVMKWAVRDKVKEQLDFTSGSSL